MHVKKKYDQCRTPSQHLHEVKKKKEEKKKKKANRKKMDPDTDVDVDERQWRRGPAEDRSERSEDKAFRSSDTRQG